MESIPRTTSWEGACYTGQTCDIGQTRRPPSMCRLNPERTLELSVLLVKSSFPIHSGKKGDCE